MASGPYRLASGGGIDRSRPLSFWFDRRPMQGFAGDTVASALLANGVRVVARSLKFRRPRGVFSSGIEEPNALVRIGEGALAIASARATAMPLVDGLDVAAQAGWPNVRFDALRVLDLFPRLFAAGFYNKTFMWPNWHWFEPTIRALAGQGRTPTAPDPDRYEVRNAHCDVLVVGGGIAGLAAAAAAAAAGQRVWLVEQDDRFGGYASWSDSTVQGTPASAWVRDTLQSLSGNPGVTLLVRTAAVGYYDHDVVMLHERCDEPRVRERTWIVRTGRVILATGCIEQPMIFDNNDRPGIMLAGAAHRLLRTQAIAPGRRVLIATNNDSAYVVARDLHRASVRVAGVVDSRAHAPPALLEELRNLGITVQLNSMPVDTRGHGALSAVVIGNSSADSRSAAKKFACDALLVSGGWNPALQLYAQAGGKLSFADSARALVPVARHPSLDIVGAAAAAPGIDAAVRLATACGAGTATQRPDQIDNHEEVGPRVSPVGNPWRQWVDLRHDVTVGDLQLAQRENYRSIEHVKRYTTVGMSMDQGKTSMVTALEIVGQLRGVSPSELGHTTLRPPVTPVTMGAIAGRAQGPLFAPWRQTSLHDWHVSHGAQMEDYGEWRRAACYRLPNESREQSVRREIELVRSAAGLFDASPLGKIEVHGPDALAFLNHFYINRLDTLQSHRARYGLMLTEQGVIFDDGTVAALRPDHVVVTTTSGGASRVARWLDEWHQCEWPRMRVTISPVTDQWATLSVAGPHARKVLAALRPSCDLSNEAFPHLSVREARLLGQSVRIYRVSFSGELTYEINVPAGAAMELWEALLEKGEPHGLRPYGVEALLHLRLEKGFLHVGTDTDGTTVPDDVGWGKPAAAKQSFIGKRSLSLPENVRTGRRQLVGLTSPSHAPLPVGAHLRFTDSRATSDGWITSAGRLSSDGSHIALAMLVGGRSRIGSAAAVHDGGRQVALANVVAPIFYDPAGERMNG